MTLVFLDTETTGLDPARHEVWEIAYAKESGPIESSFVVHSGIHADPDALSLNGYFERYTACGPTHSRERLRWEGEFAKLTEGATIVGSNPAFDTAFLRARWGAAPWHHRLWDISAYAAGVHGLNSLPSLAAIAGVLTDLGHEIPTPDHSAAGDVATLRACWFALHAIRADHIEAS